MIFRLITSAGLLALGYFIGREVGKADSIRNEMKQARESEEIENANEVKTEPVPPKVTPKRKKKSTT
ncbi:hypothetical protein [Kaarinaea lacus]